MRRDWTWLGYLPIGHKYRAQEARMRMGALALLAGIVIGVTPLAPRAARAQDALAGAKADLRRLVSLNEVYHAKNKKYASNISDLTSFKPSAGVTVTLGASSANGWAATATAASAAGRSCVIYVGQVTPPKTQAQGLSAPEAVPVCDK
jgi:hypothetical protein